MGNGFDLSEVLASAGVSKLNTDSANEQIEYISFDDLVPDPENFYSMENIDDLATSIAMDKLQQPIRCFVDKDHPGKFVVLSGHRRRAAIEILRKEDPERWQTVPCIVERDDVPKAVRKFRNITGNAYTRKMTDADLLRQSDELADVVAEMNSIGYKFPGRSRDFIAKCLGVSSSKLGRLSIIKKGLSEGWRKRWERGELPEDTALALTKMDIHYQEALSAAYSANREPLRSWQVKNLCALIDDIRKQHCTKCKAGSCHWCVQKISILLNQYWKNSCSARCCEDCDRFLHCKNVCPELVDKKAAQKEERAKEREQEQREEFEAETYISQTIDRIHDLREQVNVSLEDLVFSDNEYWVRHCADIRWKLERGVAAVKASTPIPIGSGLKLEDVQTIVQAAAKLGCSIDYLLTGMEYEPDGPKLGTGWKTGDPKEDGCYVLAYKHKGGSVEYDIARFSTTGGWHLYGQSLKIVELEPLAWIERAQV